MASSHFSSTTVYVSNESLVGFTAEGAVMVSTEVGLSHSAAPTV
jgi:hypothetical protein